MKQHTKIVLALGLSFTVTFAACAKGQTKSLAASEEAENGITSYEVHCATPPPAGSSGATGASGASGTEPPLPDTLPTVKVPIRVESCAGLDGAPLFFANEMPGLVAVVDCNAKLVRFRTRDWQVNESSTIGPTGDVEIRVMYITRLVNDATGTKNCWTRFLGHITGNAACSGSATDARLNFKVSWSIDETPPEIMEPASPGMADLRNGQHCKIKPGNCLFHNEASVGCGG